jgi:hypothetical protein
MKANWTMLPRGDISTQAAGIYVSMNREGSIVLNRTLYVRLGEPAAVHILFDRVNNRIALKPTIAAMRNAYPVGKKRRGRIIYAKRLLREFGIDLPDTIEFRDAEIDQDGQLILDLRTARASRRAYSQSPKRQAGKPAIKTG